MTEEFWQSYKKNKDAAQPNQMLKGVMTTKRITVYRSKTVSEKKSSRRSIQMNYMRYVEQTTIIGDTTEHPRN